MKLDKKKKIILSITAVVVVVGVILIAFRKKIFGGGDTDDDSGSGGSGGGGTTDPTYTYGIDKKDFVRLADSVLDWTKVDKIGKTLLNYDHKQIYDYVSPLRSSIGDLKTKYPEWINKLKLYVSSNNLGSLTEGELTNISKG